MANTVEQSIHALSALNGELTRTFKDLEKLSAAHCKICSKTSDCSTEPDKELVEAYTSLAKSNSEILADQITFTKCYEKVKQQIEQDEIKVEEIVSRLAEYQSAEEKHNQKEQKKLMKIFNEKLDAELRPEEADVAISSTTINIKCPITRKIMKEPMKNTLCGHIYEKVAILDHMKRKHNRAKCPVSACPNKTYIAIAHLKLDTETLALIATTQGDM